MECTERYTAVGVFHERRQAENAIEELSRAGFRHHQIGIAARTGHGLERLEYPQALPPHAAGGATAGVLTGGALGTLAGVAVAAGIIPGLGPIVAGGILGGLLVSAAVGAAAGGVVGALIGLGIPEEEAEYYESEFHAGRTIVMVKTHGRYSEAVSILRRCGAYDVSARDAVVGSGTAGLS
jgi:hypothetical protein